MVDLHAKRMPQEHLPGRRLEHGQAGGRRTADVIPARKIFFFQAGDHLAIGAVGDTIHLQVRHPPAFTTSRKIDGRERGVGKHSAGSPGMLYQKMAAVDGQRDQIVGGRVRRDDSAVRVDLFEIPRHEAIANPADAGPHPDPARRIGGGQRRRQHLPPRCAIGRMPPRKHPVRHDRFARRMSQQVRGLIKEPGRRPPAFAKGGRLLRVEPREIPARTVHGGEHAPVHSRERRDRQDHGQRRGDRRDRLQRQRLHLGGIRRRFEAEHLPALGRTIVGG